MEPIELERAYLHFMSDLHNYVPDGIVEVDLALLQELDLLKCDDDMNDPSDALTHNFYVVESADKLTLFNERFAIWIAPKMVDDVPTTFTLIALNSGEDLHLEMVFTTTGVYNHSSLVLRILEKFLEQIEENEKEICRIKED